MMLRKQKPTRYARLSLHTHFNARLWKEDIEVVVERVAWPKVGTRFPNETGPENSKPFAGRHDFSEKSQR